MSTKGEGVKKVRKTVHMVCVWPLVYWRAIYRGGCVFYDRQFFPYGLGTNGFFSSSNFMQIKARAWHLWQSWKNFFLFLHFNTFFNYKNQGENCLHTVQTEPQVYLLLDFSILKANPRNVLLTSTIYSCSEKLITEKYKHKANQSIKKISGSVCEIISAFLTRNLKKWGLKLISGNNFINKNSDNFYVLQLW